MIPIEEFFSQISQEWRFIKHTLKVYSDPRGALPLHLKVQIAWTTALKDENNEQNYTYSTSTRHIGGTCFHREKMGPTLIFAFIVQH